MKKNRAASKVNLSEIGLTTCIKHITGNVRTSLTYSWTLVRQTLGLISAVSRAVWLYVFKGYFCHLFVWRGRACLLFNPNLANKRSLFRSKINWSENKEGKNRANFRVHANVASSSSYASWRIISVKARKEEEREKNSWLAFPIEKNVKNTRCMQAKKNEKETKWWTAN